MGSSNGDTLQWKPENHEFRKNLQLCIGGRFLDLVRNQSSSWKTEVDRYLATKLFLEVPPRSQHTPESLYFELLNKWLKTCNKRHNCRPKQDFWPTRVIDVGYSNSSRLKILETKTLSFQPKVDLWGETSSYSNDKKGYTALSHCWGKPTKEEKTRFCTTAENYKDRVIGFSIESLPRTFQDAVQITRAIGQSYLWIDALCIIQENEEDWSKESQKMEQVFSSAYCTIAADSAKSWTQGFLRPELPRFIETEIGRKGMYKCRTRHNFENDVNNSELNKRAWVLQERVLSCRILHFAESHTYLACGRGILCEDFTLLQSPRQKEYFILDTAFPNRLTRSGYARTLQFMQHMFERYAQAGLSKKSDKERAIFGLLQRMQLNLGSECVHGTFYCFLFRLLLWRVADTAETEPACTSDTKHHLPSWSWMSHDHIKFLEERIEVPAGAVSFDLKQQLQVRIFELQDCDIAEQGSRHVLLYDGIQEIGQIWFDTHDKTQIHHCVVIGRGKDGTWFLLLVEEVGEEQYVRYGVGQINMRYISNPALKGILV